MMTGETERLVVADLTKTYNMADGPIEVIAGMSFCMEPGDTLAVIGPSGSGKSTLLNIIGSLDKPTSGSVRLGGTEVTRLAGRELAEFRANRIGFVFQEHHLLPQLTALENVLLPTLVGRGGAEASARARELLERLGVAHRMHAFPAKMSGGERQRVAVARALVNGARLMLCDEPTGNLDRETAAGMVSLFIELSRQSKVSVVMVTHNLELAAAFSKCVELRGGRLNPAGNGAAR